MFSYLTFVTGSGCHVSLSGLEFTMEPAHLVLRLLPPKCQGYRKGNTRPSFQIFSSVIFKTHKGFLSGKRKTRLQIATPFKCQEKGDEDCVDIFIFHKLVAFLLRAPHFLSHRGELITPYTSSSTINPVSFLLFSFS